MRRLGIGYGGTKYASTIGANTVNLATAALIDTIREGSIAIYGRTKVAPITLTLLTTTNVTSVATALDFESFVIFQGGNGELVQVCQFELKEFISLRANAYEAPLPSIVYVGYNGTSGNLNLPTIAIGDSASVGVEVREGTNKNFIGSDITTFDTGSLAAAASGFDVLAPIAGQLSTSLTDGMNGQANNVRKAIAEIIGNGTKTTVAIGTQLTGTSTVPNQKGSATLGSKIVTMTATTLTATSITTGDYLEIGGIMYKVASVPTVAANVATITLSRPYVGATFSLVRLDDATQGMKTVVSTTLWGLKITGYVVGEDLAISSDGVLINSTKTYSQAASYGIGTSAEVKILEEAGFYWRGGLNTAQLPSASPDYKYISSSGTYDTYCIEIQTNYTAPHGFSSKVGNNISYVNLAFIIGSSAAGDNQKEFDDIINWIAAAAVAITENSSLV